MNPAKRHEKNTAILAIAISGLEADPERPIIGISVKKISCAVEV